MAPTCMITELSDMFAAVSLNDVDIPSAEKRLRISDSDSTVTKSKRRKMEVIEDLSSYETDESSHNDSSDNESSEESSDETSDDMLIYASILESLLLSNDESSNESSDETRDDMPILTGNIIDNWRQNQILISSRMKKYTRRLCRTL